ncbi:SusC/RagA family TonB-linked outer membrane protein [Rufibacter latericius]|uniref:TonB-dependent receptor n=1 Tax=Rufibacter latericius TaxID=2487040 RepID=A0A3M9N1F0_9BACT|nr:TonB-dependent receptor [Rufibacter latericius]RNI31624.1 TonB-dependent receptor [Rufibacter latericius]
MKQSLLLLLIYLLTLNLAHGQSTVTITGRVTDAGTGEALIGSSVQVRGTTLGAQTDATGGFTIANVPPDATLVISYIGYVDQTVAVNGRTSINIQLAPASTELAQVVVVGYGTQQKRDVTGSISSVKSVEFERQSSQNPVSSIQGKVAGVQVTNSGAPGAAPQVRIRGVGSAQGGVEPLYVVDGTFVPNLSFLNPADIESMEILKDASSASIYGIRAANGVVIVTTKRGKAGETRINYNGFVGIQRATNKLEMADAREYVELYNEKNARDTATNIASTDWFDQILRTAMIHNHQISASGGSEKATYNVSAGYLKQEGLVRSHNYERITARLQSDLKLSDRVKVGYNGIFSGYRFRDSIPNNIFYQAYVLPPIVPVRDASGNYGDPAAVGTFSNPQVTLDWFNQRSSGQRVTGNVFGEWNFLNAFTFRTSLGLDYSIDEFRTFQSAEFFTAAQNATVSSLTRSRSKTNSWLWENTLTFQKTFGDHEVTALAGTSSQEAFAERLGGSVRGVTYETEANLYLSNGDPTTLIANNSASREKFLSYFGRINYSFLGKYLLTATLRYDGSSKYPESDRYDYFPSIGVGWVVTEESFMQNQDVLDFMKVRASWGKLGNNNVPANITSVTVSNLPRYIAFFNGVPSPGRNINTVAPPNLLWEVVEETDIGAEFALLNNRLTFEVDWYNKKTENAVFSIPLIGTSGAENNSITGNYATFQNRGFELAARWNTTVGNDFSYSVGVNFAKNKNEVIGLATGNTSLAAGSLGFGQYLVTVSRVGLPIGSFYGYQVDGIFQTDQEADESAQPNAVAGDFRYRDLNGDNVIDASDKTLLGNPNPGILYGINTSFTYKNIDLQLDIQGVADVDIYNANRNIRFGNENYDQDFYDNRWRGPGTSNTYPSARLIGSNLDPSSFYVESGDYIRIRNLQLGYTFPTTTISRWKMQGLRVFLNAQNPITIFDYNGFSPEVSGSPIESGIDRNVYPLSATYNLGVNVTF